MTYEEFVNAYREGHIAIRVDRQAAARLVSARMLLPLVLLPILGLGVALALVGAWLWGAAAFIGAIVLRYAVRSSAQGFVLARSLRDAGFYDEMVKTGVITISDAPPK